MGKHDAGQFDLKDFEEYRREHAAKTETTPVSGETRETPISSTPTKELNMREEMRSTMSGTRDVGHEQVALEMTPEMIAEADRLAEVSPTLTPAEKKEAEAALQNREPHIDPHPEGVHDAIAFKQYLGKNTEKPVTEEKKIPFWKKLFGKE